MAGFFGLFDYAKPGKGVSKNEPKRSHFVQFFVIMQRKFWKMLQLNLLFILFCIPIITIGPAVAAMTYILRCYENEKPVFLLSDFWDAFKSNFKQSLVYGILFAVAAFALSVAWQFYFNATDTNKLMYVPLVMVFIVALMFVFANFYVYPMIVTLELPLKAIIRNSFLFAVLGMKSNIITLLFLAVLAFVFWLLYIVGGIIFFLIGFSLVGFVIVHNSYRIIKKYAIDPYVKDEIKDAEIVFNDEQIIKEDK